MVEAARTSSSGDGPVMCEVPQRPTEEDSRAVHASATQRRMAEPAPPPGCMEDEALSLAAADRGRSSPARAAAWLALQPLSPEHRARLAGHAAPHCGGHISNALAPLGHPSLPRGTHAALPPGATQRARPQLKLVHLRRGSAGLDGAGPIEAVAAADHPMGRPQLQCSGQAVATARNDSLHRTNFTARGWRKVRRRRKHH